MGDPFGVIFGLGIDNTPGKQAVDELSSHMTQTLGNAADTVGTTTARGMQKANEAILSSRESARLLSEEFGFHLPRAVTSAISKVDGLQEVLTVAGQAGLAAFAGMFTVEQIDKWIDKIRDGATALGGFTDAIKKMAEQDAKANEATLRHFTTIAQGQLLIAETGRAIAELGRQQEGWSTQAKAFSDSVSDSWAKLIPGLGGIIAGYYGLKDAQQATIEQGKQETLLHDRLLAQLDQLTKLQKEAREAQAKADADNTRAAEQEAKAAQGRLRAAEARWQEESHAVYEYRANRRRYAQDATAAELKAEQQLARERQKLHAEEEQWQFHQTLTMTKESDARMSAEEREAMRRLELQREFLFQGAERAAKETEYAAREAAAEKMRVAAQNQALAAGAANLAAATGHRRVAAGIEVVWETAKGIAALAEWDFRGAALHFMSATEYGVIAGSGGGRGGSGGGGGMPHGRPVLNAEGSAISEGTSARGGESRGGGQTIILNIQGDFLSAPETVDRLAGLLSDAVDRRDVVLRASHVKDFDAHPGQLQRLSVQL